MITKKIFYHSSITDEMYETESAAKEAEQEAVESPEYIESLIASFKEIRKSYNHELKTLRDKYKPALEKIIVQLAQHNIDLDKFDTNDASDYEQVHRVKVTVRPIRNSRYPKRD